MTRYLYSRWDGTRDPFDLTADEALDQLQQLMMEGLDAQQALEWMRRHGFEMAGMDFRVMGVEELLQELRRQAREQMAPYNMDEVFDERRRRLDEILDREEAAQREQSGLESADWNDFRQRRDQLPERLSQAIERFRDHRWKDESAGDDFRELLEEIDDVRELEEFHAQNRRQLRGPQSLSFEEAVELMRRIQQMSQLAQDLMEGNFEQIDFDALRELAGEEGVQSLMILRRMEQNLREGGYLREGEEGVELTPRALRRLGELALDDIYATLKRGRPGAHDTRHAGSGVPTIERSRAYRFGEAAHLDAIGTLRNALLRQGGEVELPLRLAPDDLEVFDTDQQTETTTVLLLDMSWSMSWSGRWPAAKRVAVAMNHLIRTRFPRDRFFTVGFYTEARELGPRELAELVWNMDDPFTNLQAGLREAQRLIDRHPSPNSQVIVVTDGQPTAYYVGQELRVEWPSGFGGISPRASYHTLREVRRLTAKGITINTFMLDDSPELLRFVASMTRINKGRAFYSTPEHLGEFVMVDYLSQKRRKIK
ncbi:MAG: hypothetical protein J4G09_11210 [Proteobacteria bacterium]|nr:hypothetical protein [Pseudomonadota bacterium]